MRIGEEFLKINSVTGNLTGSASLSVAPRGSSIFAPVSGVRLTRTSTDEHSADDEVFICDLSDNETIDSLIARILVSSDLDPALIPYAEWALEVEEWHSMDKINTLHHEAKDVNELLSSILTGYLMDLWFDQITNKVRLSAISVWKQSTSLLTEGREIDAYSLKRSAVPSIRASRARIVFDKSFLAKDDSVSSYAKGSQFSNNLLTTEALYGKHKDKNIHKE